MVKLSHFHKPKYLYPKHTHYTSLRGGMAILNYKHQLHFLTSLKLETVKMAEEIKEWTGKGKEKARQFSKQRQ